MASTSTAFTSNIRQNYPIPGQDNDTSGFRDNFTNIANSLYALAHEVSSVQGSGVFTDRTSNFNENIIQNVTLQGVGEAVLNNALTPIQGSQNVDFRQGNYQKWVLSSSTNFSVINWPTNGIYSKVVLDISVANTQTAHVTATIVNSVGTVLLDTNPNSQVGLPITLTTTSSVLYEISSGDNGATQFVRYVGGPFV